ncbi:UbiA family prenyltransferase [soil metagenome]
MKLDTLPLVVDLDGTLLRSDVLLESSFAYLGAHPLCAFNLIQWLLSGKAYLKTQLANNTTLDVTNLPYDREVVTFLKEEKDKGRQIILATATHISYAKQIATHLNLFDRVMATEGDCNLASHTKRNVLVQEFGFHGFDYVGNSRDDLPVWEAAHRAYLVNPKGAIERRAKKYNNVERVIHSNSDSLQTWAKTLRFHQWIKNLLLFVPLFASHRFVSVDLLLDGVLAFFLFGLCASSAYLFNDLLDLAHDRCHSIKRHRSFASGKLSIKAGILTLSVLLLVAFAVSFWLLPWQFLVVLAGYYVLTMGYSFILKQLMVVDVLTLAMLYTLRIIAGAFAFGLALTFWMLAFSMFIFLSLALVKRYAELREARSKGREEKTPGRGYYPSDLEMIASLGAASGYISVMVLAFYLQDPATTALYHHPQIIWLACLLLLFWLSRIWMLTHRGLIHDDPVIFAIKDRVSLFTGILFVLVFWIAT